MGKEDFNIEEIEALNKAGINLKKIAKIYDSSIFSLSAFIKSNGIVFKKCFPGPTTPLFFMKFGRLTVTDTFKRGGYLGRSIVYKCVCDCGKECWVLADSLSLGKTISCGCYNSEKTRLDYGEASKNRAWRVYMRHAKERGYSWELSREETLNLMESDCHYCGKEPSNVAGEDKLYGKFVYNGIDRKDNTKGYTLDNCVPCCKHCNRAKRDMAEKEWFEWIDRLARHQGYMKEKL